MLDLPKLFELVQLHATPGDEDDVREYLTNHWQASGWEVKNHGPYAVTAVAKTTSIEKPTILVCAHMDSPGFIVESVEAKSVTIIPLGGIDFEEDTVAALLKTATSQHSVTVTKKEHEGETIYSCERVINVKPGDRVCYKAEPKMDEAGIIHTPFLDNRIGCFMLLELAKHYSADSELPFNLVFGATATEEFGGFGATVLANQVKPDYVICLDATYTSKSQKITMGDGPVITLSDKSVVLSIRQRQELENLFYDYGVYSQFEVYNYSGTDARAFPAVGLVAPVIALLLATEGNHSPVEKCDFEDLGTMFQAITVLIERSKEYNLF